MATSKKTAAPKKAPALKKAAPKKAAAPKKVVSPRDATTKKSPAAKKHGTRADLNAPIAGYLGKLKGEHRAIADKLVGLVRSAVPQAEEGLKWGMPVFSLDGEMFAYFRSQKNDVRFGLAYVKGVDLDDPEGVLGGTGQDGKHVKYASVKDIDGPRVASWLRSVAARRG